MLREANETLMIRNLAHFFVLGMLSLSSCAPDLPEDVAKAYGELPKQLDYNLHVKPVLSDKCFACHGPDKAKQKAGLRLDLKESAYAELEESPGKVAINAGNLERSEVFHRILSDDPDFRMPTPESHLSLSAREKAILIKWIDDGAVYKPHWAFVKPEDRKVPGVADKNVVNPIDNFIRSRLQESNLSFTGEAPKEILLRRLSLDLTGLPPSLDEIDAFIADRSPNAYEKQVDRLLASPHYGEKMATDWLDLARFADSHGYTVDRLRDMSPYRDWVIKSFNENMAFDTFIHWQLAGDLMPSPTKEMLIATAFNRNHQQNMEGGIIEEEFQTEYVIDRTNTLGDAFLGLSLGCARCHDHKYDPIEQKNYYELFSFFNNVREAGQISWDDAIPTPAMMLPTDQQEKIIKYINESIDSKSEKLSASQASAMTDFAQWMEKGYYKKLNDTNLPAACVALFTFDNGTLQNKVTPRQTGVMRILGSEEKPQFVSEGNGKSLKMNGDVWLDLKETGIFRKSQPFSIGIRVKIPKDLKEGVVLHKCNSERLYNYKGYHLYLKNDRLELAMSHTAPSNAISKITEQPVPRDQWIHLTITYDGSSKAAGLNLFMDGDALKMETTMDRLTKDILLKGSSQPGLQIGAWDRGMGLTNGLVDDVSVFTRELTPFEVGVLAGKSAWRQVTGHPNEKASEEILSSYYLSALSDKVANSRKELELARTALADSVEKVSEIMIMQEMPVPKKSYILNRGNYNMPGEEVFPNTPKAILPFPNDLPENRYGLAQWLTHPDHPLTARVAVNRFWQNFFGTGIVKTSEDFGNQGELPSHLDLLDWLAVRFQESKWNVKAINKLIVMSATYRQDSRTTPALLADDPDNRLLSRGPAQRLSAEMIRDNALAASGLINTSIGGKSVKPYQPEGLWSINNTEYEGDTGKAVYRRSLYVLVKRSVPNPTLGTFDAPSRSYCIARRQKTNTPLQALVTFNDPTFIEASCVMGEFMTKAASDTAAIVDIYRKLTGRNPKSSEIALLQELKENELKKFKANPSRIKGWITAGQHRVDALLDPASVAANAVVANTILNSDAFLTKR